MRSSRWRGVQPGQLESEEVAQRREKQAHLAATAEAVACGGERMRAMNRSCCNKVMGKEAGFPWEEVWVDEASPMVGFSPPLSRCP